MPTSHTELWSVTNERCLRSQERHHPGIAPNVESRLMTTIAENKQPCVFGEVSREGTARSLHGLAGPLSYSLALSLRAKEVIAVHRPTAT